MVKTISRFLLCLLMLTAVAAPAEAYSYAAAGKEPLLDAREAMLAAAAAGDWAKASETLAVVKEEITYLDGHHDAGLSAFFEKAIADKDTAAVGTAMRRAFIAEIERRLDGASQNLKDYQTAKVLVVKSKLFFDAMAGDLEPAKRKEAEKALQDVYAAIGNPGVFGAGSRPADPAAFDAAHKAVMAALKA